MVSYKKPVRILEEQLYYFGSFVTDNYDKKELLKASEDLEFAIKVKNNEMSNPDYINSQFVLLQKTMDKLNELNNYSPSNIINEVAIALKILNTKSLETLNPKTLDRAISSIQGLKNLIEKRERLEDVFQERKDFTAKLGSFKKGYYENILDKVITYMGIDISSFGEFVFHPNELVEFVNSIPDISGFPEQSASKRIRDCLDNLVQDIRELNYGTHFTSNEDLLNMNIESNPSTLLGIYKSLLQTAAYNFERNVHDKALCSMLVPIGKKAQDVVSKSGILEAGYIGLYPHFSSSLTFAQEIVDASKVLVKYSK